jgi:hypothetical protein
MLITSMFTRRLKARPRRDRDVLFRDRDETETLTIFSETRPRRDVDTSRDVSRPRRSRPRPHPWDILSVFHGHIVRAQKMGLNSEVQVGSWRYFTDHEPGGALIIPLSTAAGTMLREGARMGVPSLEKF